MLIFASLLSGLIFGLGLIVSGMSSPGKVIGFLDLAGPWDPSLLFVIGGAIAVSIVPFAIARRLTVSYLGEKIQIPARRDIDRRLVIGSLLFGIGWGIAGLCPGPALTTLLSGNPKAILFVVSMIAGMGIFELLEMRKTSSARKALVV
ncbi:putative membrane protein YedE/YeeE [Oxalobacteraceae bacterium GrIS 2.11]